VSERTEAVRQARDYAETLIQTANVLIVGLDEAGNVRTFNDHAERVTGYARGELLGRNWFETVVPKDRYPHVWEAFGRLQRGTLPKDFENPILTKDGRERLIWWRNSELREGEAVRGTISVGRDITERRQAEEAVRAYHELLRIAQRAANAGIWGWDIPSGKITWSEEFYTLFGLEPGSAATFETWFNVLHTDDRRSAMERIEKSIWDRTVLESEYRIIRPDGSERWIRALGNTVYDENGRPQSMSGICIDVTAGKRAEEALRASEARFRLLTDTAGRLLSADDPQDIVEQLCRAVMTHLDCHAFFNFMVDEDAGRLRLNACAGIPEEEARKLASLGFGVDISGCVAVDQVRILAEDIFHTADERTEWLRSCGIQAYCCHPLKSRGRLIGILSFGTKTRSCFTSEEVELMRTVADQVSVAMERVRVQRELRTSQEALRLANEELERRVHERTLELTMLTEDLGKRRDDLRRLASELVIAEERERKRISVILHDEVAQTLAAAKMRLDLLRSLSGGDETRKVISEAEELIGQSIRQTRALMMDITNPVLYDMGLKAAVEALAEDLKARQDIPFTCTFAGELKNLEQEAEVMIFQLVKELAQNVVKHSGARNASIHIGGEEDSVRVTVPDDGAGFDPGSIGMAGAEGGFGLFSIRERVTSCGGRIAIESAPGNGSRVSVVLPKTARKGEGTIRMDRVVKP
jgi:PAS domain S-box-containing protein